MTEEVKNDVQKGSSPSADGSGNVVKPDSTGDDKDKNFAELRKKLEEKEAEIERLKAEAGKAGGAQSFELGGIEERADEKPADKTLREVFNRDLKEATLQWTRANKVTPTQWAELKAKIRFTGSETISEIKDLIDKEYHALPEVRAEREKTIRDEAKKEVMKNRFDDELDIPGGGDEGPTGGGNGGYTRIPRETRSWGKALGLTDKEIESINPEKSTDDWEILDPAYKDRQ